MTFVEWSLGAIFTVWFALTVLANVRPLRRRLTHHDLAGLLPDWALFASPRVEDHVLLRRDVLRDGTLTSWRELELGGRRRWYNALWNPGLGARRARLALAAATANAARDERYRRWPRPGQGTADAIAIMTSVPYLSLLKYVTVHSPPGVDATQFMWVAIRDQAITGRDGDGDIGTLLFVSEFHRVPPAAALR